MTIVATEHGLIMNAFGMIDSPAWLAVCCSQNQQLRKIIRFGFGCNLVSILSSEHLKGGTKLWFREWLCPTVTRFLPKAFSASVYIAQPSPSVLQMKKQLKKKSDQNQISSLFPCFFAACNSAFQTFWRCLSLRMCQNQCQCLNQLWYLSIPVLIGWLVMETRPSKMGIYIWQLASA